MCHIHKRKQQNEVNAIQDLLQCSRSSVYRLQKRASTKRGNLIAQVKNTSVNFLSNHALLEQKCERKKLHERVKLFFMQRKIGDFHK